MNELLSQVIKIDISNLIFLFLFFGCLSAISAFALIMASKGNSEGWMVAVIGITGSILGYINLPVEMLLPATFIVLISSTAVSYVTLKKK